MRALLLVFALTAHAADTKIGGHAFTVADGFEIARAAGPPLVERPITMALDETGALYVTDSSGSNEKPEAQVKNPTHRVVKLVDRDGDGTFDDNTVFADKLSFPEGSMWLDGSLYVAAPPVIWKLTDTDADGIADRREVWFDGKTLTGCANDLHGPYAGPDGFIYWCKGAFAEQRHTLADGKPLVTKASHVFRARPDGSGLENVMTGGMDNPVDVVFTPAGERLVSGTFFVNPGGGQRDGILHAVWGGVYGKEHAVLDGHPRTGELMPVMTHLGPAAACGLELTRSPAWGAAWLGNVFCCNFNLRRITRHVLAPDGATFKTTDSDFVLSDNTDFHPTDLVEDADGSLLIADTGGWYKLCCPTSQLVKADVLGAIYRVRKKDAARVEDPRGLKLDWKNADAPALAARLVDARPAVVERAMAVLGKMGEPAITAVAALINTPRASAASKASVTARLNAIWTLTRIPGESARAAVRFAFADASPEVRAAACASASLWRDKGAAEPLINHLTHASLQIRRIAAEALGRIGDQRAAPHLLVAAPQGGERFLEHSLSIALWELGDRESISLRLRESRTPVTSVDLIAANGLGVLTLDAATLALSSLNSGTARTARILAAQHPEWAAKLTDWFRRQTGKTVRNRAEIVETIWAFHNQECVQQLIADQAAGKFVPPEDAVTSIAAKDIASVVAFDAMAHSALKELPPAWARVIVAGLQSDTGQSQAVRVARAFHAAKNLPPEVAGGLHAIAGDASKPEELRIEVGSPGTELEFAL